MKFVNFIYNVVRIQNKRERKPLMLRISTMTVMGGRKGSSTPLDVLKEHFKTPKGPWTMTEKSFNNCITIYKVIQENKRRSVKLFPNGIIHITGCSNPKEVNKILNEVQGILDEIFPDNLTTPMIEVEIQLINATFKVPHHVDQLSLVEKYKMSRKYVTNISFNPETYSAVKANMFGLSASVFKTGSVVLSGAKTLESLICAYDFLNTILYDTSLMGKYTTITEKPEEQFIQKIKDFYIKYY